jgi:hypothetical protein
MVDFVKSMAHKNKKKSNGDPVKGYVELVASMLSNPEDAGDLQEMIRLGAQAGVTPDMYMEDHDKYISQYEENIKVENKFMQSAENRSRRSSNVIDILAPLALTMLGGALAEGGVTPDMMKDVGAATFTTLSYMRPSFAQRAGLAFGGSGFKIAMAMNQNPGDSGKALTEYASREVGFAIGSMVMGHLLGKEVRSGESPLGRKLRAGGYLDIDKYASSKAITSSVSGALLSAVMGTMMGGAVQSMVANRITPPPASIVDYALDNARATVSRADAHRAELQSAADLTVSDEMGAEDVDHTRETDPIEYIQARAIDQMEETDYTWSTPGYVMIGISDNSEGV